MSKLDIDAPSASAEQPSDQSAVIDIGSNSVRMVIYRQDGRAFWPIFNEKVLAGLGRGLSETGKLSEEGVESALAVLRRFRSILDARRVDEITAFATAAVRDAKDGKAFRQQVEAECGFSIKVLSGADEARMTAYGVIAGGARGPYVVGDLGGSSLELIDVAEDSPGEGTSLKLGPLAVMGEDGFVPDKLTKAIDKALDGADRYVKKAKGRFFAVGGAWRNLARIDMMLRDYPLNVLHHYAMPRAEALKMADFAMSQSPDSLSDIPGASSRRAPTLPYAALLLKRVIERFEIKEVVISAFGVREGALFNRLPSEMRADEPLIASAAAFARRLSGATSFGGELGQWLEPVFEGEPDVFGPDRDPVLRAAAALLTDLGAAMHPNHRAQLVSDQVLFAPFSGLDHDERCYMAAALHHRYSGKTGPEPDSPVYRLLAPEALESAMRLGLGLRLGAVLSARTPRLLTQTQLKRKGDELLLSFDEGAETLAAETAEKRLSQLAGALGLEARIKTPD